MSPVGSKMRAETDNRPEHPTRIRAEILIVLGLSFGWAAVRGIWILVERFLRETPLGQQTTTVNPSASSVDMMDVIYQFLVAGFRIVPALLAVYLLANSHGGALARLGLPLRRTTAAPPDSWLRSMGTGALLAAAIGMPGLVFLGVGRALGITTNIRTSGLGDEFWVAAALMALAVSAAVSEEIVVVGYLVNRLEDLTWRVPMIILTSSLLRGAYHAYQGVGPIIGNVVMGVVFTWYFIKTRKVGPLVFAHFTLDTVAFVGPDIVPQSWLDALNLT